MAGGETLKVLLGFYTPDDEFNDLVESGSVWTPHLKRADGTVTRATRSPARLELTVNLSLRHVFMILRGIPARLHDVLGLP